MLQLKYTFGLPTIFLKSQIITSQLKVPIFECGNANR